MSLELSDHMIKTYKMEGYCIIITYFDESERKCQYRSVKDLGRAERELQKEMYEQARRFIEQAKGQEICSEEVVQYIYKWSIVLEDMAMLESFPAPAREMIIQNHYNVANINLERLNVFYYKHITIQRSHARYLKMKNNKSYMR